jgi:hypothetical protein
MFTVPSDQIPPSSALSGLVTVLLLIVELSIAIVVSTSP